MSPRVMTVLAMVLLIAATIPVAAQVRYKDSDGVPHWVNSLDDVPEQYRAGAVGRPVPPAPPSGMDWEQRARDIDRQREQERRGGDQQAEPDRNAPQRATADPVMTRGPATALVTIVEFSDYQ